MRKVKYYYNTHTLKYEKLVVPWWKKILSVLGFISAAIVTSVLIITIAYHFFASPNEIRLKQRLKTMEDRYKTLNGKINAANAQLSILQKRDNQIYRSIFEASPIPDSARAGKEWQEEEYASFSNLNNQSLVHHATATLNEIQHKIAVQRTSYDTIDSLLKNKQRMLAHIPAIQPIANKDLSRIASGFGYRIDPIYKTIKLHPGIDFAAPRGTPIYATGDGVVEFAGENGDGYGKHVIINNGYGYETLYGHMLRTKVRVHEKVKRGEVIGWVGNSGKSTGPHCHYEVIKKGDKVDPVYYFYNDLTPEQYDRMLKIASSGNQSLD